ncbi:MAG: hypothetical protein IPO93_06955 [Actinobacteria bacterium]|nr:hypothetical protein [Actinomycetota bacterium]
MRIRQVFPTVAACALLAACGSSTGAATPSPAAPEASPASVAEPAQAVVAVPMPSSSPTGELTCGSFDMAAAHFLTYAHYAGLNVGTNNDTTGSFSDMNEAMGILTAMAPECAPDSVEAIAALGVAAGQTAATYKPGDDEAVKAADKAALEELKAKGVVAWDAMGLDPAVWDTTIRFVD